MELGAENLGTGLSGTSSASGSSRTSGSADDYYKSLLARVDNAIVETKSGEGSSEGGGIASVQAPGRRHTAALE